jgi:hypothetical protein
MFGGSLLLFHHLGYRLKRENLKNIIEVENDLPKLKAQIQQTIIEHDNYKNNDTINDRTADTDNKSLHHAMDHILAYERTNETNQKNRIIRALLEET